MATPAALAVAVGFGDSPSATAPAAADSASRSPEAKSVTPPIQRLDPLSRSASRTSSTGDSKKAPGTKATKRARLSAEPEWLADCMAATQATLSNNGQIPEASLCDVPGTGHHLTKDAARAWVALSTRYVARFDEEPCITDSYRSLSAQQLLRAAKPGLAAQPGTSNHGWAEALDLCGGAESYSSEEYTWLSDNGPRWGWQNPEWAKQYGSKPEPWHWEYTAVG